MPFLAACARDADAIASAARRVRTGRADLLLEDLDELRAQALRLARKLRAGGEAEALPKREPTATIETGRRTIAGRVVLVVNR